MPMTELDLKAVNTIRMLAVDAVEKAGSGHPGMPMGMAQPAYILWTRFLRHSPTQPDWTNRDRFVLSAGHGSMLLYALLHLTGYAVTREDLRQFRQWRSATPGHPEHGDTPGVETTTGPLGQGFGNGVGMALAAAWMAARYNRKGFPLIEHHIYGIVSDGDLMEGVAHEAAALAGHLRLGRIVYLYDDNRITIDGGTELSMSEDWAARFRGYGWHVQNVDGMDAEAVTHAIEQAQRDERPSIIGCRTTIGYGSPNKEGSSDSHGAALGADEVALTRQNLDWPATPAFLVPEEVETHMGQAVESGKTLAAEHAALVQAYEQAHPQLAAEWRRGLQDELPSDWDSLLPSFAPGKGDATRNTSGKVLNALADRLPNLIGGSADLAGSNKTDIDASGDFLADDHAQRNLRFGVREHGMASILNGMALYGGVIPYGGTFLVFTDYMRASMRLAALMGLRVIYVLTHDSIGLGEDGPTHQPIEHLATLRAMPNMNLIRPADGAETAMAWRMALENGTGPTVLALTRQTVPEWDHADARYGDAEGLCRGAYVLHDTGPAPEVVLIASGSEVEIAMGAAARLASEGMDVRVVSMPCWELFARQSQAYRDSVLPEGPPRLAIEAAASLGWERWVGHDPARGDIIGIDRFGASAPYERLYEEFGLTADAVARRARKLLGSAARG